MKNKSYIGISFIVLIFGIWAVPKIIAKFQKSDLVEIGPVPAFKLKNQDNKTISDKDYLGKVYVVEFFFSTCPTICPKMNESMLQLQNEFYGNPNFREIRGYYLAFKKISKNAIRLKIIKHYLLS